MYKYNYVFVGPKTEDIQIMYQGFSLNKFSNLVLVDPNIFTKQTKLFKLVWRIWKKMNLKYIDSIPFIYKRMNSAFVNLKDNLYCFIIYSRVYEDYGISIIKYLKSKFPNCKTICYFGDLLSTHPFLKDNLNQFDYIFTFDKQEALKYNFLFCQEPFSFDESLLKKCKKKYDVTFVGAAKDRFPKIIEIYEKLKAHDCICDFHIFGVPKENQLYADDIIYNSFMSFRELLYHVTESSCILEVLQDDAYSPTARYAEAILYKKNLLTNCKALQNDKRSNVFYFDLSRIDNIDFEKIKNETAIDNLDDIELLSCKQMIKTISSFLE